MVKIIPANDREWIFLTIGLAISALVFSYFSAQSVSEEIVSQDLNSEVSDIQKADPANTDEVKPADVEKNSDTPEQEPFAVEISGAGAGQSEPFPMNRGNYKISYQTFKDCVYYADLELVSGERFSESVFKADAAVEGTNNIYNIDQGLYYISVITGPSCAWEVEFVQFR